MFIMINTIIVPITLQNVFDNTYNMDIKVFYGSNTFESQCISKFCNHYFEIFFTYRIFNRNRFKFIISIIVTNQFGWKIYL